MRSKLMLISLALLLSGCSKPTRKGDLNRFLRYMKEGDFAHATAMETRDCDDALNLRKLEKTPDSYPEATYGKMHDTIKSYTKYTLTKYVRNIHVTGEKNCQGYITVRTKGYVLEKAGFSDVLKSKAYRKVLKKTMKKEKKALDAAIRANDSDEALMICYNAMAEDVGKLMKKNIDKTAYDAAKLNVTFTPNGQICDIEMQS